MVKDVCGNTLTAPTPVEGGTYTDCQGTKTYTYTYTDCAGKEFVWTYTYNIVRSTAPAEVGGPVATSSIVECASAATAPTALPVVKDVCGNTIDASTPEVINNPATITCGGTRTYKYTYTDCAGKTFVWNYVYTILPPVLTFTNDGTLVDIENVDACYSTTHATQLRTDAQVKAMYSSNCDKTITVSHVDEQTKTNDCDWMITRTFTITDGCNTENKVQKIFGSDRTAPTFTVPAAIAVCRESDGTYANAILPINTGNVTDAADACSTPTVGYTDATPITNADGTLTIVRTWKATDACGKYTEKDQIITVNPLPTLTVTNKTQTGLHYGDNIQLIEITNTNSNLTVTPAGTYSHIQYNVGTKTITSSNYLTVGTYQFFLQAVSNQTPECNTLKDTVTVTVGPKTVTLVSGDAGKMYDGSAITNADVAGKNANGLVTETGWVGTDGATYTFTGTQTAVGSSPNAFSYTPNAGTDLSNYTIDKTEGILSITSNTSVLYVESTDKSWTYNGSAHTNHEYVIHFGDATLNAIDAGNGTYTATLGTGDVVTITPDANATITNVAETTVDNAFTWTVQNNDFYTKGTDVVGKLSIVCKEVTITANSNSKTYNGSPLTDGGFTASALETGDTHTFTVAMTSGSTITNVGTQANVIATVDGVNVTPGVETPVGNYCVTTANGELEVTCKKVTITAHNASKVYDSTPLTESGFTASALETGDTHTFTVAMTSGSTITNVGTQANVIATVDGTPVTTGVETPVGNYCVTTVNGELEVTCKKVTITAHNASKVYDSTPLTESGFTASALETGDTHTFTVAMTSGSTITNVGTQANVIATVDGTPVTTGVETPVGNYCVTTVNGELEVTCKKVTITANSNNKIYDGTPLTDGGFTATPLETGDTHTFVVTMTSGSTITNVGTQANVIATVDGTPVTTGVETPVGNYCVTTATGTLTVTSAALLIELDTAKIFDGTPFVSDYMATTDGYTITGLVSGDYITAGVVTSSAADVNTYIDSVASASADVTTPFATHNGIGNYNVTYDLRQVINKKRLIITGEFTKVYDGEEFKVYYNQLTYNGLVNGDAFTSGTVTTDGYRVGDYYCRDNRFLRAMDELHAYNSGFGPASVTANYTPEFHVVLHIIVRPIEFTAKSGEKVYDGTPLQITDLPAPGYDITSGSIASTDNLTHIDVSGSQLCVGSSASEVANAVIMHVSDAENVTDCYDIHYVDGTLRVTDVTTPLVCPADLTITLWYGRCDTMLTLPETATVTPPVANTTIVNDLARQNPMPVGTHYITWSLLDACGNAMTTCQQTVTVNYPECDTAIDYEGNRYPSERIGCNCWTVPNLRSKYYSDGTEIANYTYYNHNDSLENVYGKLYSWYSAARVPEDDDTAVPVDSLWPAGTYVQGICPAGWALPTVEDYMDMYVASGADAGLVKSPSTLVWLPGKQGTAPNKFNAYGAGYYDGSVNRYFNLLGETHFWAVDYSTGSSMAKNFVLNYYCSEGLIVDSMKGFGYSIRCVQKK